MTAGSPPLSSAAAPAAQAVADEELDHIRVFMRVASGAKGSQVAVVPPHAHPHHDPSLTLPSTPSLTLALALALALTLTLTSALALGSRRPRP